MYIQNEDEKSPRYVTWLMHIWQGIDRVILFGSKIQEFLQQSNI